MANEILKIGRAPEEIEERLTELRELERIYTSPANSMQYARQAAVVFRAIAELEWSLGGQKPRG